MIDITAKLKKVIWRSLENDFTIAAFQSETGPEFAEKIIFSASMGIAGQIDLLMFDDETNQGILIDWKTNSKITDEEGAFGTMLAPIDHLKNCDVVKYGLQLGLYEKILIDEKYYPEFDGYRKALVHVKESFGKVVKVGNYAEEIECLIRRIK